MYTLLLSICQSLFTKLTTYIPVYYTNTWLFIWQKVIIKMIGYYHYNRWLNSFG
jgi:hypothetical protein